MARTPGGGGSRRAHDPGDPFHLAVYTDATERGGAEAAMGMFIERFRPNISVTVLGPDEEVVRWLASRRDGARYAVLPGAWSRTDVRAMWDTRRALARLGADLVHFNLSSMSSCQWALSAALTIPGLRIVVMEHSPVGTWSSLSKRLKQWTSSRVEAHVTVGHRAAEIIEGLGDLPPGSLEVIHSGVPLMELDPPERATEDFTVGMLSRHDPVKGIDLAIRVVHELGPGFRLVVVGDGAERPALEALVAELGVGDRVELRPFSDDARHLYPTFDVYLLPSRLEAFPVTVQEAMQAGVAVVATDVGSVREAVDDGETGFVVPVGDVGAMAAAVRRLADDRGMLAAMGARAAEVGRARFDAAEGVRRWEQLYDEVLAGTHRRP
jgi:glycosyltransferase involved in cell wall biosynthesis